MFLTAFLSLVATTQVAIGQGETTISPSTEPYCFQLGECTQSLVIGTWPATNPQNCLDICQTEPDCQYFTYYGDESECLGLANCEVFSEDTCSNCKSGKHSCQGFSKLIVVGGLDSEGYYTSMAQVVDLPNVDSSCDFIGYYPQSIVRSTVGLVDGVMKSCGGNTGGSGNNEISDCYDYDPSTGSWVLSPGLIESRDSARSSMIGGQWLVSGGEPAGRTTEYWSGSQFVQGPDLPEEMYGHCQLTVNSTHIFFADCADKTAYLLDWNLQEWTQLDSMTSYRSHYCGCGLIHNIDMGTEAVVTGYGPTEIFNFDSLTWRFGSDFQGEGSGGFASVQLTDTFLLAGGYDGETGRTSDKVYFYDQVNYDFVLFQELEREIEQAGAVVVPDEIANC